MKRVPGCIVLALGALGCFPTREQSVLDPAGPHAAIIRTEFHAMLLVAVTIYVIVVGAILFAARSEWIHVEDDAERELRARRVVTGCVIGSALILAALFSWDVIQARALERAPAGASISIMLTGRQWWWEVEYVDSIAQRRVRLANEIHIPVGRDVRIELESRDVIHSFWVPNLHGKKDLIPGKRAVIWLRAWRPGVYRAQCAEFCGLEHARMALPVIAESEADFAAWLEQQRTIASQPAEAMAAEGRDLFESGTCSSCHAIQGTRAASRFGPDLSHIGSRLTIGAGTLDNRAENLAAWIADPHRVKPGVQMPPSALPPEQLRAIVTYLESLR